MTTYRQAIFMVLDLLKMISDDSFYNEEHIMFLLSKYRGLLLKQRYKDIKKDIPESNFQTLCLDLIEVPAISGEECEGGSYLRTAQKIPNLMTIIDGYLILYMHLSALIIICILNHLILNIYISKEKIN